MDVNSFYSIFQIIYCLFGVVVLVALWRRFRKIDIDRLQTRITRQNGILWLAFAVGFWMIAGSWVLFSEILNLEVSNFGTDLGTLILSSLNNFCLLCSLPYFNNRLEFFNGKPVIDLNWRLMSCWLCLLPITIGMGLLYNIPTKISFLHFVPDMLVSLTTLCILAWFLWRSFRKQGLKVVSWVSLIAILLVLLSQFLFLLAKESQNLEISSWAKLSLLSSKVFLITTFIILIVSWLTELYEKSSDVVKRLAKIIVKKEDNDYSLCLTLPSVQIDITDLKLKNNEDTQTFIHFVRDKLQKGENSRLGRSSEIFQKLNNSSETSQLTSSAFNNRMTRFCSVIGVKNKDHLFKSTREGRSTYFQLKVPKENIELIEDKLPE